MKTACSWCSANDVPTRPTDVLSPRGHSDARICETCDAGTRKNDRALRERYIREGLIVPRVYRRIAA